MHLLLIRKVKLGNNEQIDSDLLSKQENYFANANFPLYNINKLFDSDQPRNILIINSEQFCYDQKVHYQQVGLYCKEF